MFFTFGSFGDILAAAQLAASIATALSDSRGSSIEYQYLIAELKSLSIALKLSEQAVCALSRNALGRDAVDAVVLEIGMCQALMERFWGKVRGYQRSLGAGGSGSSWRKIGWGLFKAEEVAELRAKLAGYKTTIILFLLSSTSNTLLTSDNTIARFEDEARRDHMAMKIVLNQIYSILRRPGRSVWYSADNALKFVDALGRNMVMPMELCGTRESFEAIINVRFKGRAGSKYVERGDYDLSYDEGCQLINPVEWAAVVKPGVKIEMSIVMRKKSSDKKHTCPRCKTHNHGVPMRGGWIDCYFCQGMFQVFGHTFDPALTENSSDDDDDESISVGSTDSDKTVEDAQDEAIIPTNEQTESAETPDEMQYFRRIRLTTLYKAQGCYKYFASEYDPNEVSFNKGEIIEIPDVRGKWWNVRKADGTIGIAPSNYLRVIHSTKADDAKFYRHVQLNMPCVGSATALSTYVSPDEAGLSLTKGETLDIIENSLNNMSLVRNADGMLGNVPSMYLDYTKENIY